jgi:AcrR family transcriptional regulator
VYASRRVFKDLGEKTESRTRRLLQLEAKFREMLATTPYGQITLGGVADACGIVRSTVYRYFADRAELLWVVARPHFERLTEAALVADSKGFETSLSAILAEPGLVKGLLHRSSTDVIRKKLAVLIASGMERRSCGRDAESCALVITGGLISFLEHHRDSVPVQPAKALELMYLIYVAAYLTPEGVLSHARGKAAVRGPGRFPPAVSERESLASPDNIVSIIDGRP